MKNQNTFLLLQPSSNLSKINDTQTATEQRRLKISKPSSSQSREISKLKIKSHPKIIHQDHTNKQKQSSFQKSIKTLNKFYRVESMEVVSYSVIANLNLTLYIYIYIYTPTKQDPLKSVLMWSKSIYSPLVLCLNGPFKNKNIDLQTIHIQIIY